MNLLGSLDSGIVPSLLWGGLFALLIFAAYWRRIFSIFDPLNIQAIAQVSACILAVLIIKDPWLLAQFFASQGAFIIGFLLVRPHTMHSRTATWQKGDIVEAEAIVFILFLSICLANVWLGLTAGFPIFADDPSVAKFETFTGGLGAINRLNSGAGIFLSTGSLILAIKGHHRILFRCIFFASVVLVMLGGSKGGLLGIVQILAYLTYRRDLVPGSVSRRLRVLSYYLIALGTALAVIILRASNDSWNQAATALGLRILLFGDSIIYYYSPGMIHFFSALGPLDYIADALNPILGAFRLVEYKYPIGYQMVTFSRGEYLAVMMGPNTPFYISGHIYFGPLFGVIYSGAVGYVVSRVRRWYLTGVAKTPFGASCACSMALLIFILPTEVSLFSSRVFDTFVPIMLIAGVVRLSTYGATSGSKVSSSTPIC